ncbi:MAG: hypothetical protein IPK07_07200 [Deltaproteobacteria bacterium]|nr:hypothetical protein [Deltaproteobacteria bacterium]
MRPKVTTTGAMTPATIQCIDAGPPIRPSHRSSLGSGPSRCMSNVPSARSVAAALATSEGAANHRIATSTAKPVTVGHNAHDPSCSPRSAYQPRIEKMPSSEPITTP